MINDSKSFCLFQKINSPGKGNNLSIRDTRFLSPSKSNSFRKLPDIIPNTSKHRCSHLNMSLPFEESTRIVPIVEFKRNNIPNVLFMKQYLNLKRAKCAPVSLKKMKNHSILSTYMPSGYNKLKKPDLSLSCVNDKTVSNPLSKELYALKRRSNSRVPMKLSTSALNINHKDNIPIDGKWKLKKYGFQTKGGETNNRQAKINQDTFIALSHSFTDKTFGADSQVNVFGVCDGHGEEGHNVSHFVKKVMENYFTDESNYLNEEKHQTLSYHLTKNNYQIIFNVFAKASEALKKQKFNCLFSGTTCILVIVVNDIIICANVGDSRAVLFCDNKSPIELSTDHKPQLKEELERIVQSGGEVSKVFNNDLGPYRVWVKNENYPGLAMSRSIGDFLAEKVGVISTPEIKERCISSHDSKYIVIGSDGLWEWLSVEEVQRIVLPSYKDNNVGRAVKNLVEAARKKWVKKSNIIDDITVVVLFFGKT